MKSRLGFAVATSARADILIADEVLSTGDRAFQKKCEGRMANLLEGGTTLLFVSHSITAVERMCQNVLWLDAGVQKASGPAGPLLEDYKAAMEKQ